jgi:hypothetical protein
VQKLGLTPPGSDSSFAVQEYVFKVQATTQHGHDEDRLITVGKVKIDMAQFAMLGHKEHHTVLQMPFSAGKSFTQALPFGQLRLKITAHMVKVPYAFDSLCKFCCCNCLHSFCCRLLHSLSLIAAMESMTVHSHQYSTQHAPSRVEMQTATIVMQASA